MNKYLAGSSYYKSFVVLIALCFMGCFKDLTKVTTVYFNDFEHGDQLNIHTLGWIRSNYFDEYSISRITTYNGTHMLGRFNNGLIYLQLSGLPVHDALRVEMDLYIHDKWRNDLWKMVLDGKTYLQTGFSNDDNVKQSYPNWIGNGSYMSPAGNQSQNRDLPGACAWSTMPHGTSQYKIQTTFVHTGNSFRLECSDAGEFFNDTCQRSWSIDNLKISTLKN